MQTCTQQHSGQREWRQAGSLNALLFVFALAASSSGTATLAATASDIYNLSLAELLDVKVSGSTLVDEKLSEVPAAVTVFTYEQIQRLGVSTLAELMNFVPGYQSQRSGDNGGYSMASSRKRRTEAASSEILIVVDGYRTQSHFHSGSSLFLEMPVNNIQRIEFIRGPGSAIYGSNAMMGVINIVTVKEKNSVLLEAGDFGNKAMSLLLGKQVEDKSIDLSVDVQDSSGQSYQVYDAYSPEQLTVKDPYLNTNSILKARLHDFSFHMQYRYWKSEEFFVLEGVDSELNEVGVDYLRTALSYNLNLENFSSTISLHYVDNSSFTDGKYSAYSAFAAISNPQSDAPLAFLSTIDSTERNISLDNNWSINQKHKILFGAAWRSEEIDNLDTRVNYNYAQLVANDFPLDYYGEFISQPVLPENFMQQTVVSSYLQWLTKVFDKNDLTVGIHYDVYKEIEESNLSPRFAWVHKINNNHSLKLLYAHAFRAPTLDDLNADTTWSRGSPTLQAETVATSELIWTGRNEHAYWNLGYFISSFDDPILQEIPDEEDNTGRVLVNSAHDDIAGFEFDLNYEINASWLTRFTATYIHKADEITFRESNKLASFEINYSNQNWNANLSAAWRSEHENYDSAGADERRTLDAYWLSFARVQYRLNEHWQLFVRCNNLTDETIWYASAGSRLPQGVPSRGREFNAGFSFNF